MKIAIIGAGYTGLSAALALAKTGHSVQVYENDPVAGGLAGGFKLPEWDWPLEKHYHHLFVSDRSIRDLGHQIKAQISFYHPRTSTYYQDHSYHLDSPLSLMQFPKLSLSERIRTGIGLGLLKATAVWQPLEKITAKNFITKVMGINSWNVIWEPLFRGKFGKDADKIAASWFWARIYKRSSDLGYPDGGFTSFTEKIAAQCQKLGVKFCYSTRINKITSTPNGPQISLTGDKQNLVFDAVICTLSSRQFTKITPQLPPDYVSLLNSSKGIGAINLVLSLSQSFLKDGTYWLNMNDRKFPFLAIVEHTNMIDKVHYAGNHLIYIGNYLPSEHEYFSFSSEKLFNIFLPYLRKINPSFDKSQVNHTWIWKSAFAQPLVTLNYSRQIPPLTTPLPGVYLANIQQVYPWDRGTNYAVELGERIANELNK